LKQLLEVIFESHEHSHHLLIVVGEDESASRSLRSVPQLKSLRFTDLIDAGTKGGDTLTTLPEPVPSDVVTISFYGVSNDTLLGVQLTHENIVAGVTATRALLPLSDGITPSDVVYSAHSLSTSIGRVISYTALYEGSSFATLESTQLAPLPNEKRASKGGGIEWLVNSNMPISPTVIFVTSAHLDSLTTEVMGAAKSSLLFGLAFRHKMYHLLNGYMTGESFWDRMLFAPSRARKLGTAGGKLRAIVVTNSLTTESIMPSRVALSVPLVRIMTDPLVSGPVFASHPLDLQLLPPTPAGPSIAHVGPPSINVEVMLANVDDAAIETGQNPSGELLVRGPSVGKGVPVDEIEVESDENWTRLQRRALVMSNGTFTVY